MQYYLKHFADRHFPNIEDRKLRYKAAECQLVGLFFEKVKNGYFLDIGACHPKYGSQTWHLEERGWRGIVVEPLAELCTALRKWRPRAITVQAACGAPQQRGQVDLHVSDDFVRSTLEKNTLSLNVSFTRTDTVELKTVDDILKETHLPHVDFVSIDVEGLELDVLRGFNLEKYKPQLLLVEDHLHSLSTHRYLRRHNYYLAKRTGRNNWYVPVGVMFKLTSPLERFLVWQAVWLSTPFRKLRIAWKAASKRKASRPTLPPAK